MNGLNAPKILWFHSMASNHAPVSPGRGLFKTSLKPNHMPKEVRTSKSKVTVECAESLRKKFKLQCKKHNTSMAQVIRDYMQAYVKH